jgi:hypothetical protein
VKVHAICWVKTQNYDRAVFKGGGGLRVQTPPPPEILEKKFLAHENLQYF